MWVKASELKALLDRRRHAWDNYTHLSMMTRGAVSDRAIRRIMNGHSTVTKIDVAERLLDVVGYTTNDISETHWHSNNRKLSPDQAIEIRARRATGEAYRSIAMDYPVEYMTLWRIVNKGNHAES